MALGQILGAGTSILGSALQAGGAFENARAQERATQAQAAVRQDTAQQQQAITQHLTNILQQLSAERGAGLGELVGQMTEGRQAALGQAQADQAAGIQETIGQLLGPEPGMAQGPAAGFDLAARQRAQAELDPQLALAALQGARQQVGTFEQQAGQQFALGEANRARTAQEAFAGAELGSALLGEQLARGGAAFQEQMRDAQRAGGGMALGGALLHGTGNILSGVL